LDLYTVLNITFFPLPLSHSAPALLLLLLLLTPHLIDQTWVNTWSEGRSLAKIGKGDGDWDYIEYLPVGLVGHPEDSFSAAASFQWRSGRKEGRKKCHLFLRWIQKEKRGRKIRESLLSASL
jgi:hypothetical protein